jgi:nucleoside-diphosphate-sugar epimerase
MASAPLRCAITGPQGYVGSSIKRHVGQRGGDVLELARRPRPGDRAVAFQLGAELAPDALAGVTALVHCAYDFRPLTWEEIRSVNVDGTRALLRAARAAGVERIVCISSISAYEGCRSLYGKAKLEIEQVALGAGALIVRPGLVYGPRPGAMFGRLVALVKASPALPIMGDGRQVQFLVHQEDLAAFVLRFVRGATPAPTRPLTAAHDRPWTLRQLLTEIGRALHRRPRFIPVPWRGIWVGLKAAELCGARPNFRSDSLVSLMYQNPRPDFSANAAVGLVCRPFEVDTLDL